MSLKGRDKKEQFDVWFVNGYPPHLIKEMREFLRQMGLKIIELLEGNQEPPEKVCISQDTPEPGPKIDESHLLFSERTILKWWREGRDFQVIKRNLELIKPEPEKEPKPKIEVGDEVETIKEHCLEYKIVRVGDRGIVTELKPNDIDGYPLRILFQGFERSYACKYEKVKLIRKFKKRT